jgi:hypothetical protein
MSPGRDATTPTFSRRSFIVYTAGAVGAVAYGDLTRPEASGLGPFDRDAVVIRKPDFSLIVRRAADQCVLTLGFWNMTADFTKSPPTVKSLNTAKPNYLTVTFGVLGGDFPANLSSPAPQNIAEQAFPLVSPTLKKHQSGPTKTPSTSQPVGDPAVVARVSGSTHLAFIVPNSAVEPGATSPLTLDTDSLLSWINYELSVVPAALPPLTAASQGPPNFRGLVAPSVTQTAIEMPYRVVLSPPAFAAPGINQDGTRPLTVFVNATDPVTHANWTELWHTRMAAKHEIFVTGLTERTDVEPDLVVGTFETIIDETDRAAMTVRAVWCTDLKFSKTLKADAPVEPTDDQPDFNHSLKYADRYDIVRLSSDFTKSPKGPLGRTGTSTTGRSITSGFIPSPATVDRLMLTSLGGWLECDAHWNLPHQPVPNTRHGKPAPKIYNSSLLSWRHRAVQGRDSYVRVVRKGYLFPWGHLASLVTITEREIADKDKHPGAYLRQKTFIVVSGPVKNYGSSGDFAPWAGHGLPFTSVEALTLVTPDIEEGGSPPKDYTKHQHGNLELCFEPKLSGNTPFRFHFLGTDWAGAPIDFHSPVVWVDDTVAYGDGHDNKEFMKALIKKWHGHNPTISLHNQRVSVAPPIDPGVPGNTQLVVSSFLLDAVVPRSGTTAQELINASQPAFYPSMRHLTINSPEAEAASGHAVGGSVLEYNQTNYLNRNGFNPAKNPGGIFLNQVAGAKRQAITFKTDHSGGAITPNIGIDGMSRAIGPVSGTSIDNLAKGKFEPGEVFPTSGPHAINAKLLGGIELKTILQTVSFAEGADNSQAFTIATQELQSPHRIVTTVDWHPPIQSGGPPGADDLFDPTGDPDNSMNLHAVIVTSLDPSHASTSMVTGQIVDFDLNLYGTSDSTYFIQIPFDSLTFRAQSGKKTDVQVQVNADGVAFKGPLSFVQDIASYLNFDGSGLTINTAGSAITADLTLSIPNITCGVFALDNIAFSAGVAIPYNGDPVVFDFAFCTAENPFQLEIMIFTGGGYVGLTIGPNGIQSFAVSFDFGLGYSIDIGIASGQISLVGGVSYSSTQLQPHGQKVDLTAYVKASGGISALGVISVSVELYLGLTYQSTPSGSQLIGEAQMSISVHVLFFGFSVSIDVQETFAGSSATSSAAHGSPAVAVSGHHHAARRHHLATHGAAHKALASGSRSIRHADVPDPTAPNTFGGSMTADQWDAYCTSFALVG